MLSGPELVRHCEQVRLISSAELPEGKHQLDFLRIQSRQIELQGLSFWLITYQCRGLCNLRSLSSNRLAEVADLALQDSAELRRGSWVQGNLSIQVLVDCTLAEANKIAEGILASQFAAGALLFFPVLEQRFQSDSVSFLFGRQWQGRHAARVLVRLIKSKQSDC